MLHRGSGWEARSCGSELSHGRCVWDSVGRRVDAVKGRREGERSQRQRAVWGRMARVHVSPWSCRLWCGNVNDDGINLVHGVDELI